MIRRILVISLLLIGIQEKSIAQHVHAPAHHEAITDSSTLAFLESVRQGTKKYQDIQAAITAGYRPIGPDMPNMGQHWIHTELARRRGFNPSRPGMLTYLRVDSVDVLTGVAFTQPVLEGESPPELSLQGATWHFHFRTLETEAISPPHHHDSDAGPRLAMLHAWVWKDNPDGVFAADNWGLPFVRVGLDVPPTVTPASAKALFLLEGGVSFYVSMAGKVGGIEGKHLERIRVQLENARESVDGLVELFDGKPEDLENDLGEIWKTLQKNIAGDLGRKKWKSVGYIFE